MDKVELNEIREAAPALLIEARGGVGKTRSMAELAAYLCEVENWVICVPKTDEKMRRPSEVPAELKTGNQILFVFDDLHMRLLSQSISDKRQYMERLGEFIDFMDEAFGMKFRAVATLRSEPHFQRNVDRNHQSWNMFDEFHLPDPDSVALSNMLVSTAEVSDLNVAPEIANALVRNSDLTLRTIEYNIRIAKAKGENKIDPENWMPTSQGSWSSLYKRACRQSEYVDTIYNALYLARKAGVTTRVEYINHIASKLLDGSEVSPDISKKATEALVNNGLLGIRNGILDIFGDEQFEEVMGESSLPDSSQHVESVAKAIIDVVVDNNQWLSDLYTILKLITDDMNAYQLTIRTTSYALRRHINTGEILLNRSYAYYELGKIEQAFECLLPITNQTITEDHDLLAKAYRLRTLLHLEGENFLLAINDIDEALKIIGDDALAFHLRGICYAEVSQFEHALTDVSKAIELDSKVVGFYIDRMRIYFELNQYSKALQDVSKAIELEPENSAAHALRCAINSLLGHYEQALQDINKAIELDSECANSYYLRSAVSRDLDRYEEALQNINKAIELEPEQASYFNSRALLYRKLDRNEEALQDLGKAIKLEPENARLYYFHSMVYQDLDRYEEALPDINKAIELEPEQASYFNSRALLYRKLNRNEEALQDLGRAIKLDPENTRWYINRSELNSVADRYEQALQDMDKAIEIEPKNPDLYDLRSAIRQDFKQYEEALQDINRAIELESENPSFYNSRSMVYRDLKQYEEALQDINRAIELDPTNSHWYYHKGLIYGHLEQYNKTLVSLNKAIETDPNYAIYHDRLGYYNYLLRNIKEAMDNFRTACELDPEDSDIYNNLAFVTFQLGRISSAESYWSESTRLSNPPHWAFAGHAIVLWHQKRKLYALEQYNRAIEAEPRWLSNVEFASEELLWTPEMINIAKEIIAELTKNK